MSEMVRSGLVQFHPALQPLLVGIDTVEPWPGNYNNGDIDAITESIEINGMYRPIIVQHTTGYIIAGNTTWAACKNLDAELVPVLRHDIDDLAAERMAVADNHTAELAVPDNALLLDILDRLAENDSLLGTAFTEQDRVNLHNLAEIPLAFDPDPKPHATWPVIAVRVPPHVKEAYYEITEPAAGDRERFELLMRKAGWLG